MAELTWQYIAGFFDGEGSIDTPVGGGYFSLQLDFSQSGPDGLALLNDICSFLEARGIHSWVRLAQHRRARKLMYRLRVGEGDASLRCLVKMLPYLRIKRTKAQDVLRYRTLYPPIRVVGRTAPAMRMLMQEGRCG